MLREVMEFNGVSLCSNTTLNPGIGRKCNSMDVIFINMIGE
jgi:hypothetical protein